MSILTTIAAVILVFILATRLALYIINRKERP